MDLQPTNDHDLLIELRTEMRGMRTDIKGLSDNTAGQIADHEIRIRALENKSENLMGKMVIGTAIISILVAFISDYIIKIITK